VALIQVDRDPDLTPDQVWERVTDWRRHGDVVPLTTVTVDGDRFTARTGLGPLGFDDVMEVVSWDPPRRCRIEKRGRLVRGWAEIDVRPRPDGGAHLTWREDIHVRGVPRFLAPLESFAGRLLFTRTVDALLAG
jgi:carbon monoxide dehydrogenase subunit G